MSQLHPPRTRQEMDFTISGESHVRAYRETNGEQGYIWNDAPTLLLTTKGRESGEPRTTPLIFARDDARYVVIASRGGAPRHPYWYLNLLVEPRVQLQVKADVFEAVARTAAGEERERLWAKAVEVWPQYDDYKAMTDREIPVVVLERLQS